MISAAGVSMRTTGFFFILLVSCASTGFAEEPTQPEVPLFDGLSDYSRKIGTNDANAQRYFDQGLMFMFAYNHDEAVRAFRQSARLDPECAMAHWGIALASGMNYNDPSFTPEKANVTSDALARARQKTSKEANSNQALIDALAARYPDPAPEERAEAEKAYSDAMKVVWEKYSTDADIGALYAESLMNLRPWDLWDDILKEPEPPDWFVPARHALGAILLQDQQADAAEKVYREDLRRWPENGWSLHGLAEALEMQGKKDEAAQMKARFKEVWKRADIEIQSSCFCVETR